MPLLDTISLKIPTKFQYLSVVSGTLQALCAYHPAMSHRPDVCYNLQLAIHEACANVIEHAYQSDESQMFELDIEIWEYPARLVIKIRDRGRSFDPEMIPQPALGKPQVRGFGMFLMQNLLDQVSYETLDSVNCWTLVKNFEEL
ncbi:MAG TPA: ATP-binding protein [Anaerolineales bacterium]|nr:ATP-binding protein [Anaerolineales bacterium]